MKVKVKKVKKNPAPIEQDYDYIKSEDTNKISEPRFAEIIKGINDIVLHPKVSRTKKRLFPDLKISEYAKFLNL